MSINWVMLDPSGNFVTLPGEQQIWKGARIGFSLTTPRAYPAQEPLNIQSSQGIVYLTNQRVVYLPEKISPEFQSFSASLLNLHDTHISFPWFGPNQWIALVQPVAGGNIPQNHHVELKITFKEGGAPDYHTNFERIKERLQQAVETARASNTVPTQQSGLNGINMEAVHLDELPSYESSGQDRIAPDTSTRIQQAADDSVQHQQGQRPESVPSVPSVEPPSDAPPGYEETQQRSVQEELDRRFGN